MAALPLVSCHFMDDCIYKLSNYINKVIIVFLLVSDGVDYTAFDEVITLSPGDTGFSYQVEILSDNDIEVEPELFQAQLSIVGTSSSLTLDEDKDLANITITDINSMFTYFLNIMIYSILSSVILALRFQTFLESGLENVGNITLTILSEGNIPANEDISLRIFSKTTIFSSATRKSAGIN